MTLSHRGFLPASLLCAALACLMFLPGLPGAFVLDDVFNIVNNPGIRLQSLDPAAVRDAAFGTQFGGATRVLPTLTFALDYLRGGGLDPATFKATNLAIHGLTTLVLAWLLRDLLQAAGTSPVRARWMAMILALAWAMHPLQVSSVLYIVQRMQTLATLFVLLALWAYLRARLAQIEGRRGRTGWILAGMLWALALGCKEDAVLLPVYLLLLELTVLRFAAADPGLERALRRGWLWTTALGVAFYLFFVVPHFWSWEAYPGRDFSSYERLLTQGRVLCMYLWQILVPLPGNLPFYYDWIQPSRGLLQPWTTMPAFLLLLALLGVAWSLRHRRPLFSFGILLFFAGHFVTSNVVGLELAFEHRNHLPLVGIVLAVGDLLTLAANRLRLGKVAVAAALVLLAGLAGVAVRHASTWQDGLGLAQAHTRSAPDSGRAWQNLCVAYYELGGGRRPDNPYLGQAIDACEEGARVAPDSITSLTNVIVLKAIEGTLAQADWDRYLARLETATITLEARSRIFVILDQVRHDIPMDDRQVLAAIEGYSRRMQFPPIESAALGYFILGHTREPDRAYPFFEAAVRNTRDPEFARGLVNDLHEQGRTEWAARLQAIRAD